ncbi:MAG: hypothetical protein AAF570_21905 [Bacteroidota bacterium]
MASETRLALNAGTAVKLSSVIPMVSMVANQMREAEDVRVEAVIQEKCTSLHPTVKWRFEEEAQEYMRRSLVDPQASFGDIVFENVYPLFGQLDIRGSSTLRNEAIAEDLQKQMHAVLKVLDVALESEKMPVYEELSGRVRRFTREISNGLLAGSEHNLLSFLHNEIYPVFDHLRTRSDVLAAAVSDYMNMLDTTHQIIYERRRDYDDSVRRTNDMLASVLDKHQVRAHAMFPHYFERYKTDGGECNMFIGDSMVRDRDFHPIYLSNLRLWQLIAMAEMEIEYHHRRQELPVPLEVASLILVNSSPLTILFGQDEKRFDVDGAYNARYEIIKKRVDKAMIKGTKERVTAPGKIAIIYTSEQDVVEYMRFIRFLQDKGLIASGQPEKLDIDDLPGVTGLKALRVSVCYSEEAGTLPPITATEMEALTGVGQAN